MVRHKEQRQSPRQWVTVPVLIRNDGLRIEGLSINISEGGIYVFAAAKLAVGTQIDLEFRLPNSKQAVRTCGTVRRRAVYLYGIEFSKEDIAPARERSIKETNTGLPSSQAS